MDRYTAEAYCERLEAREHRRRLLDAEKPYAFESDSFGLLVLLVVVLDVVIGVAGWLMFHPVMIGIHEITRRVL